MANELLQDLDELVTPSSNTLFYAVDVSGGNLSKKMTYANLISGALTPPVLVSQGGTGLTSLTSGSVLVGNGTSAVTLVATTGSGSFVRATSPTLVTPTLGVATATSINKVTVTAPATSSTLTIDDGVTFRVTSGGNLALSGKTATFSNSITIAGTDGKTLTLGNSLGFTGTDSTTFAFPSSSDTVVTLTATQTLTNKTLTAPITQGNVDGWVQSTDSWGYASATTFTIAGVDRTALFTKGTRIKLTQTTTKYFVVVGSVFSTNTTVTVTGGADYSLVNAAITSPAYSYQMNPQGYPGWFNHTPTWSGFSADPSSGQIRFRVDGSLCTYSVHANSSGTSNATTCTINAPVTSASITNGEWDVNILAIDSSAAQGTPGSAQLAAGSTVVTLSKTFGNTTNWTNSGTKNAWFTLLYEI